MLGYWIKLVNSDYLLSTYVAASVIGVLLVKVKLVIEVTQVLFRLTVPIGQLVQSSF